MSETSLPPNWSQIPLGEQAQVVAGFGFPIHLQGKTQGDFPFYKVGDISRAWLAGQDELTRTDHYLSEDEAKSIKARPFPSGTTVFAKIGAAIALNRRALLGRPSLVDNNVMGLIPNTDCLDHRFIFNFSKTLQLAKFSQATTVPSLRKGDVENIQLPLPPLNEQRRIVAKIEDLSARGRRAKEALDAIPPLLERFRQSVLAAAFRGDLTKQWRQENPHVEPASELLQRIRQERRQRWEQDYLEKQKAKGKTPKDDKWKAKYQEPEPVDTSNLPELPQGWEWAKLNDFVEFNNGDRGKNYPARSKLRDEGYAAFVNTGDIRPSGLSKENTKYLSQSQYDRLGGGKLAQGDLVFCIRGATIGKCAVYLDARPAAIASSLVALRPSIVPSDFLWYLLQEPGTARTIRNLNSSSAQPNISTAKMEQVLVALAPHDEQPRIAEILGARLSAIEQILNSVTVGESRLVGLDQSILAKAFRGELVPQDPNDEPASVLLERIRAERKSKSKG